MNQILNPFDEINPLSSYSKFKNIIMKINDKKKLLEISLILDYYLSIK